MANLLKNIDIYVLPKELNVSEDESIVSILIMLAKSSMSYDRVSGKKGVRSAVESTLIKIVFTSVPLDVAGGLFSLI